PEKCVHVGDSLADDIAGARRSGIHSVLIDRGGHYRKSEQERHEPHLVIRDLRELL
ncbi:MAG: HAD hydrolase-like protein, partial [Candidatus Omnitrophica bacterium]|nr:HAD hydrolase-like protein [Candidatus Omnitrophota bacterium]